jgi:hypothetical protein
MDGGSLAAVGVARPVARRTVEGDVELTADDRLDAVLDGLLRELQRTEQIVGVPRP